MSKKKLGIALLGQAFMGRAHSNAWRQVTPFFSPELEPELTVACGRDEASLKVFADEWGWKDIETDWRKVLERDDVDVIDISLPQHLHAEVAIEAAKAGKHIFCEKPIAHSTTEALAMKEAAEKAGVVHYLNHNYRRVPAVVLAKQLIEEGKIGEIYHWRGAYQQSWLLNPDFPVNWKLKKDTALSGPLWDLGSHNIDLALHLVGAIDSVSCQTKTFIKERPLASDPSKTGEVDVDDAALLLADFKNGAMGTIETTRYAYGRRNRHTFEIYGSKGALTWDLEDINHLHFASDEDDARTPGFRKILATEGVHDYAKAWWPPGHVIGWEHTFVHAVADFIEAIVETQKNGIAKTITPNFDDGLEILGVLEAAMKSSQTGERTTVA